MKLPKKKTTLSDTLNIEVKKQVEYKPVYEEVMKNEAKKIDNFVVTQDNAKKVFTGVRRKIGEQKKNTLTKKEKGFAQDFVKTGHGTKSALKHYNVKDEKVASVIASENLAKPKIQNYIKSIADQIPDELLVKKHNDLLKQKKLDYFVFSKAISNDEIEEHMIANGLKLINIRWSDKGKMAFYSIDDAQAIKGGLELAYKLKGSFAPEKKELTGKDGESLFSPEHKKKTDSALDEIFGE